MCFFFSSRRRHTRCALVTGVQSCALPISLIALNLVQGGLGISAFIGIGGDPIIGTTTRDAVEALDKDARTKGIVLVGEIGGAMEEEAAEYASGMKKPVVAFIAGAASPPGKKMGHEIGRASVRGRVCQYV